MLFVTELKAIDPKDGILKTWTGPNVPGVSIDTAEQYCQENGLGYLTVLGQLLTEIPCKPGSIEADFSKRQDFDQGLN